jgi:hypothetical protein
LNAPPGDSSIRDGVHAASNNGGESYMLLEDLKQHLDNVTNRIEILRRHL